FSQNPPLKLPELNPYFATDFSLNPVDKARTIPQAIIKEQGKQIYTMGSRYFPNEPKASLMIAMQIVPEVIDLKLGVSAVLLGYMSDLALNKLAFQASVAGIHFSPMLTENGIAIGINGYTQHLDKLLHNVISQFSQFELSEDLLTQSKQRYIESLDRLEKDNALRQAATPFANFARYPYMEESKKRAMVEKITLADIEQIRQRLLTQATGLSFLSVGSLSDDQAKTLVANVEKQIKNHNSAIDFGRYLDISQSQRKLNFTKAIPHEDNALIMSYFPNGYDELQGRSLSALLRSIVSRWYFDDLRTDKQLGYVVYATNAKVGKTYGLQFAVQSPTASPQSIMQHNERFFGESLAKLNAMPADEFEKYRHSLIEKLEHKPESLAQEFEEFVADFTRGNDKFDDTAKMIEQVKQLTQQQVIDFFKKAMIDQHGFVFASQAIGTKKEINQAAALKGFEKVESIEELQKAFELKSY
ncbi:MAG: insulinase family protein, partial [Pasteurellaceae bacterium]|nr:insulinase family protein [Pasteurellaceae bacterium]